MALAKDDATRKKENVYATMVLIFLIGFVLGVCFFFMTRPSGITSDSQGRVNAEYRFREICLNGVVYYEDEKRLSPKINSNLTAEICN